MASVGRLNYGAVRTTEHAISDMVQTHFMSHWTVRVERNFLHG
jgi:hypothetical protein